MSNLIKTDAVDAQLTHARNIYFDRFKPAVEREDYHAAKQAARDMRDIANGNYCNIVLARQSGFAHIASIELLEHMVTAKINNSPKFCLDTLREDMAFYESTSNRVRRPHSEH